MPWLPFYADQSDFDVVVAWLNQEPDLAWIVGNWPKRWQAVPTHEVASQGRHCLWHTPSGPLPLIAPESARPSWNPMAKHSRNAVVTDPWTGWEEKRTGADPSQPYFGADHAGVIWLNARIRGTAGPDAIGMSSFEWIGNRYRVIGQGAADATSRWWQRLRRQITRRAVRIPRDGPTDGPNAEIWALPSALQRLRNGTMRDINPA